MGTCSLCGLRSPEISEKLGVCLECIRNRADEALEITDGVHAKSRKRFNLPPKPPQDSSGLNCGGCMNNCRIGPNSQGFCGLVYNIEGKIVRHTGVLEWYYDPLPTNCVAAWFCAGCTGAGYPKYAYMRGPEIGYQNLAVFYGACSLDCLFCQNWHYRDHATRIEPVVSAESLAAKVDEKVSCICYFGGDPSPQMPHALATSELALEKAKGMRKLLRICWETNGYMVRGAMEKASLLSLESGGTVKFDLKAHDDNLNKALCGVSNKPTFDNFKFVGERFFRERTDPPLLTASTLLVPGYIDSQEVKRIAEFVASIDPEIPYTLLAFYPCYVMNDLPTTRRKHAYECLEVAKRAGLQKVRIGNIHLLS